MLNLTYLSGFLLATAVIVLTPGSTVALASSQAVRYGPKAAVLVVIGDAVGTFLQILIATAGLKLLLEYALSYLPHLQIMGGGYILYLSYIAFRAPTIVTDASLAPTGFFPAISSGFVACVTNPKSIIFFIALFPSFIDPTLNIAIQSTVYGFIFILLDAFFIMLYALLAFYIFNRDSTQRININMVSGCGFLFIASLLIFRGINEYMI
ncbi:LysE family translocator [Marinomonas sp. 2405UD68-3]|uniref:LysE family translocator n=1 Tax=Marinomonas sp. 2405UD68-3 TaxID=3391835 RepID=UPI0039C8F3CE